MNQLNDICECGHKRLEHHSDGRNNEYCHCGCAHFCFTPRKVEEDTTTTALPRAEELERANTDPLFFVGWSQHQLAKECARLNELMSEINHILTDINELVKTVNHHSELIEQLSKSK